MKIKYNYQTATIHDLKVFIESYDNLTFEVWLGSFGSMILIGSTTAITDDELETNVNELASPHIKLVR
ncbi:hypothetical protein VCHA53O466_40112 [Vibrio chagasii]|nr:hypothetical protein VCHA53O466_40112 [Vibrio chagasii]